MTETAKYARQRSDIFVLMDRLDVELEQHRTSGFGDGDADSLLMEVVIRKMKGAAAALVARCRNCSPEEAASLIDKHLSDMCTEGE